MRQSMTALQERLCRLPPWGVTRQRDLLYIGLGANEVLVIAADSAGGLGPKPADTVAVPAEIVGRWLPQGWGALAQFPLASEPGTLPRTPLGPTLMRSIEPTARS